jgi:hypothetical protein
VEADLGIIESKLKRIVLPWANAVWTKGKLDGIATNGFEKQLLLAQKYKNQ